MTWIETPGHADLENALAERADVRQHVDVTRAGELGSGDGPGIALQGVLELGFEPVEATRALPLMSAGTIVLMNTAPVIPFVLGQQSLLEKKNIEYPDVVHLESAIRQVAERVYAFDATQLATETGTGAGSAKALNMLMLGCMLSLGKWPFSADQFWETAAQRMPPALVETSKSAFARGVEIGKAFDPAGAPL